MTPSSSETIAGDSSHYIMLNTDVGYAFVQWFVKGADGTENLVRTNIGSGLGTIDYLSSYDYAGLGSTTGNKVTVKAVAYRNAGNHDDHDTETVEITVWEPIRILGVYGPENCVVGESVRIRVQTNIPASKVEFTIGNRSRSNSETSSSLYREVPHTFEKGEGSDEGEQIVIEAVAYATVAGKEISSEPKSRAIHVHEGRGKLYRDVEANVSYFYMEIELKRLTMYSSHGLAYYNDVRNEIGGLYVHHILYEIDPEGLADGREVKSQPEPALVALGKLYWSLALKWSDTVGYFTSDNGTHTEPNGMTTLRYDPATMTNLKDDFAYYGYAESRLGPGNWKAWGPDAKSIDDDQTEERVFPGEWVEGVNFPVSRPTRIDIDASL